MSDSVPTETKIGVASERIAAYLREAILNGDYPPGSRIRQEDLAAQLGSSRLPVREALRIVEADGLITLKSNSGAWVAKMDYVEFDTVYKMRERLDPLALTESIPNLTGDQIEDLYRIQGEIEANTDSDRFLVLDREFHLATYAGAGVAELRHTVVRFWNTTQHYRRAYARLIDGHGRCIINYEHRLLLDAISRRDSVDAERFLAGHIRRTRVTLERHPELFD